MPLVLLAFTLSACSELGFEHPDRIGVLSDGRGNLVVMYRTCRGDTEVTRVRLLDASGTRGNGADDRTLWAISGTGHPEARRFVVGQTPDGFRQEELSSEMLGAGHLLRVTVESSALPQGESAFFTMMQLGQDRLRVGEGYQSMEDFVRGNACG